MKKIILSLGVGLFLWAFATHVKVSVDSPMQLVTEQALAQGTEDCWYWYISHSFTNYCDYCIGGGVQISCAYGGPGCYGCECC